VECLCLIPPCPIAARRAAVRCPARSLTPIRQQPLLPLLLPPPAPPDPPAAAGAHSPQHDGRVGHHLGDVPLVRVYQMLLATS